MNFLSDLSSENDEFKYFIKNLVQDMDRKHPFATSQEIHFREMRYNNLSKGDVELQIKSAKSYSGLSSK